MGLSFTIAAGPRQRSHFQVRVPQDSWPHFTVSDSRLPQPGEPCLRIYILQGQGGPVITPGTGFPFRRLLRLARATEKAKLLYNWRFTANQFVLATSTLIPMIRNIFQLNRCGNSPYVSNILSNERMGLSLMNRLRLCEVYVSHKEHVLCQYRLCRADLAYLTCLTLQRQLSHLNGRKLDRRQV
jgi:hypothetical protein